MKKFASLLMAILLFATLPAAAGLAADDYFALLPSIRILGTNGTVTAAVRFTPRAGGTETNEYGTYTYHLYEMIYTTDGAHWQNGTLDGAASKRSVTGYCPTPDRSLTVYEDDEAAIQSPDPAFGVYNGSEFLAYGTTSRKPCYYSADGIHWNTIPPELDGTFPTVPLGAADLGPYRFELDSLGEQLYLVAGDTALLLPDVGQHKPEIGCFSDVKAYYIPDNCIRVEIYPQIDSDTDRPQPYITVYSISSLEWVLKNKEHVPWHPEELLRVTHETGIIRSLAVGPGGSRWEHGTQQDPSGPIQWQPIATPWEGGTLYPWNGKSFLMRDDSTLQLYASEDGVNWRCLGNTFLAPEKDTHKQWSYPIFTSRHGITWTGTEYMACRRTVEEHYGMFGSSGGRWYSPACSKVYFADQNFQKTGEYDFGRQVEAVGYQDGVFYAKVSKSTYLNEGLASMSGSNINIEFPGYGLDTLESDLYLSTDKIHWETSTQDPSTLPLTPLT